ncbi:hypothetical protein C8F01DRAFT_1151170, partial [Mycena amicta]
PPLSLTRTAHASEAPELEGNGNRWARYYFRLFCFFLAVVAIVMSTYPYDLDHPNNVFAGVAKVVLMIVVAYLPGYGPLELRTELSDICQWICCIRANQRAQKFKNWELQISSITCMAITIFIWESDMWLVGIAFGLLNDLGSFWLAMVWKSESRAGRVVSLPHRLILALFPGERERGEDLPKSY